jgi:hypothetical protein
MEQQDFGSGTATPEGYDDANQEALHVLNVCLVGESNRNRVVKFTCGRILHFKRHLPEGSSQRIRFDLRGQAISSKMLELVRKQVIDDAAKHGIQVTVEFLTN